MVACVGSGFPIPGLQKELELGEPPADPGACEQKTWAGSHAASLSDAAQALVVVHVCCWQDQAFGAATWLQHPALLGLPQALWEAGDLVQVDVSPCGKGAVVRKVLWVCTLGCCVQQYVR